MDYDYLIVGCGFFGAVFAREMTDAGKKCLVIDKRNHIGGNAFTENMEGVCVHKYGAHIFHTNDKPIWDYVNRFAGFNHYRHKVFIKYDEKLFSFPINLMTLYQLWGVSTPAEARLMLEQKRRSISDPKNLEEWILSEVGEDLYEIFIKGYTAKQWGRAPHLLPSFIIKRIPIRTDLNDFYFDDKYQGIPIGGYTQLFEQMLTGIEVRTITDFLSDRVYFEGIAKNVVYTGKIDEFFGYCYGELEYRSLHFEHEKLDIPSFQGTSVVNYTNYNIPYTRILEHKFFELGQQKNTVITREYPKLWKRGLEPYYPVNDQENTDKYKKYEALAMQKDNVIFGGRLAEYRYYDMHQVVGSALKKAKLEKEKFKTI